MTKHQMTAATIVKSAARITSAVAGIVAIFVGFLGWCTWMPGPRDANQRAPSPKDVTRLEQHVRALAVPRNNEHRAGYQAAEMYIVDALKAMGHTPHLTPVVTNAHTSNNIWVEIVGVNPELVVVGAHYDSAYSTPGADDNASGVAIGLELVRRFTHAKTKPKHSLRFMFFANEEPPYFRTPGMGSVAAARALHQSEREVVIMFALEMLGYFDDTPGSQRYPPVLSWFYPDTGNFVAFVANLEHRAPLKRAVKIYRDDPSVMGVGFSGPDFVKGIDFSDHMPFWNEGFAAVMITDTSFFRNPNYHKRSDTPDTLDYVMMARVVASLAPMLAQY